MSETAPPSKKLLFPGGAWEFLPPNKFKGEEGDMVDLPCRVKLHSSNSKYAVAVPKEALIAILGDLPPWVREFIQIMPDTGTGA